MKRILAFLGVLILAVGCDDKKPTQASNPQERKAGPNDLELVFLYGSEKKDWLNDVTRAFNDVDHKSSDGRQIHVTAVAMGSGECVDEVLSGRRQAHLISPASAAFIIHANAQRRAIANADLVERTEDLVLSPVVIAMWKPMAQALGWPDKPIGWSTIMELAKDPRGWAAHGHPEWGQFRFGHTHPEYSNSGLITVLAQVYAAGGKQRGLSSADLADPKVGNFIGEIERAVVHYGSSTGFFADKMFENGTSYLSAAVVYESSVIDSYNRGTPTEFPVVAIYPKEGSFWSDHPIGIVQREWVSDAHKAAAKTYIEFLRAKPQQEKALQYGFRPADTSISLADPISNSFGVDPAGMKSVLEVPGAAVISGAIDLWRKNKKHANIVLVFDCSGSMNEENRMASAKPGAAELLKMLGDNDAVSIMPFSDRPNWAGQNLAMGGQRESAITTVNNFIPNGGTALYDSIAAARKFLIDNPRPDRISAVVVLTDGEDTSSKSKLNDLLNQIKSDGERAPIRVFTIGYGKSANKAVLKQISDQTKAKSYEGTTQNIREVFKDIATFF